MWFEESVFYQIYPLGLCGAPRENDGGTEPRILKLLDWVPHIKKLGADAVYFCPVFESDAHGYDTRDYTKLDGRLGTNADFARVCAALHAAGIRVVLDGVFNHVGRGFWAFRDVLEKREASPYRDWFHIDFGGNSGYNDGLWYEGWEGHYIKYGKRNAMEIATLGCAVRVKLSSDKTKLEDARLAYGVAAPTPIRCPGAEEALRGCALSDSSIYDRFAAAALTEVNPRTSWRASREFRLQLIKELAKRALKESIRLAGGETDA